MFMLNINVRSKSVDTYICVYNIYIQGESKIKCDLRRLVQKCNFFVQLSCRVFFKYFLKICNFFGTSMAQKNPRSFFLSKSKVHKNKNVQTTCFYRNITF